MRSVSASASSRGANQDDAAGGVRDKPIRRRMIARITSLGDVRLGHEHARGTGAG